MNKKKKGFSLIELLASLVVISIILGALMPIFTKRLVKSKMTVKIADSKKGLQIYTNPGSYSFDVPEAINKIYLSGSGGGGGGAGATKSTKTLVYTTNNIFTIPTGVNTIKLTITGAGGGGGASNGNPLNGSLEYTDLPQHACLSNETLINRGSDDGRHFCIVNNSLTDANLYNMTSDLTGAQSCSGGSCCWSNIDQGIRRSACSSNRAEFVCSFYQMKPKADGNFTRTGVYRLMTKNEASRLNTFNCINNYFLHNLNFCDGRNHANGYLTGCTGGGTSGYMQCVGAPNNLCSIYCNILKDKSMLCYHGSLGVAIDGTGIMETSALSVRCIRPLDYYTRYSGAGGASGAQLERIINVLPKDTLEISIGQGGNGGTYGSSNGKGKQGTPTTVIHKRNGVLLNTYYVNGALGGLGATTSGNGVGQKSDECSGDCTVQSYAGGNGTNNKGGAGGIVANTGTPAEGGKYFESPVCNSGANILGGYCEGNCNNKRIPNQLATDQEIALAKGQNATVAGFGGGGGYTPTWATNSTHFYSGGKGANGKVELLYDVITPGGGGGAGANAKEIEYNVTPGERIIFTIGKGGMGGASNQIGKAGTPTSVMENHIIFNAGSGGGFGSGGNQGTLKINSSKAKIQPIEGIITSNIGLGTKGEKGQMLSDTNYGFDGGSGGTTFLGYFGGCGGGIMLDENEQRGCQTSSQEDASETKTHNAVKDEYGGAGGGGGGIKTGSTTLGAGSNGADGYLRIRWGEL